MPKKSAKATTKQDKIEERRTPLEAVGSALAKTIDQTLAHERPGFWNRLAPDFIRALREQGYQITSL